MKLYIPTTTLNFNNILSNESISPASFYKIRGFGYSRWTEIPENVTDNYIVLYDSFYNIGRDASEIEDHPLVIAINTQEQFQEIEKGIFITDKTIYLNPWNTEFIFFSNKDKLTTLSLSDSSLETKMIRLYQKNFLIQPSYGSFPTVEKVLPGNVNQAEISHDRIINRLKGLLYGYYIGALLSIDKSKVEDYNILKELLNIFASILSNPSRIPSPEQRDKLSFLLFSHALTSPINKNILSKINEIRQGKDPEWAIEIFKIIYFNPIHKINISSILKELQEGPIEENGAIKWVTNELNLLDTEINKNKKPLSPDDAEIIVIKGQLHSISKTIISDLEENKLFIGLINYILTDNTITGKTSSLKTYLADTLTVQAKKILGANWDESYIRKFLNQLRRHVRGEQFNQEWNNGILSSLAAVILKGDDWESLLDFMKRKGMTDYRLAYAFYGIFNGFANLTRDFTDLLLNNENRYVASVYQEFHGQLHNEPIITTHTDIEIGADKSFAQRVLDFYRSNTAIKKQEDLEQGLRQALHRIGNIEDGYVFVCVLNDYPKWSSRTTAWKEMQREFCPEYEYLRKFNPQKNTCKTKKNNLFSNIKDAFGTLSDPITTDSNLSKESNQPVSESTTKHNETEGKIHFNISYTDTILRIIGEQNPNIGEKTLDCVRYDLEWALDPEYSVGKSELGLLKKFEWKLNRGKNERVSKFGKQMDWKIQLYQGLDIEKIIKTIKDYLN